MSAMAEEKSTLKDDEAPESAKQVESVLPQNILEETISDPSAESRQIGKLLHEAGKVTDDELEKISHLQKKEDIFFGEAAKRLGIVNEEDIQYALAKQFNYPYLKVSNGVFDSELVAAYQPFSEQAEVLRGIRSQLSINWLGAGHKALAIVSPSKGDGRSYLAANLAVMFAQANKRTLLVDCDFRNSRQHEIFKYRCGVGLSAMLVGRVRQEDLERLPEAIPFFTNLSVLGAGAKPPNPLELLSGDRFHRILNELSIYYDVILLDSPAGEGQSDFQPISVCAGSALMVTKKAKTKMAEVKKMTQTLNNSNVNVVGSVMMDF